MRLKFVLPLFVFLGLLVFFFLGLGQDPSIVPSPLIDRPAPEFDLPPLDAGREGFKTADFMGKVTLVNFFASWCLPCKAEHPLLMQLQKEGRVRIAGVNYKDDPEAARRWLRMRSGL